MRIQLKSNIQLDVLPTHLGFVNAPGWIDSDMMRKAFAGDPARQTKIFGRTPIGRFVDADDIGWAAVYLCSPAAKFVTGGASIGF